MLYTCTLPREYFQHRKNVGFGHGRLYRGSLPHQPHLTMPTYHIGGHPIRLDDSSDAIPKIPENNMLFAMKLTDAKASNTDVAELKSEKAVYEHFKPGKKVRMKTADGRTVEEEYRFKDAGDLELNGLVEASPLLSSMQAELEQLREMIEVLQTNTLVREALADAEARKHFQEGLGSMKNELI